MEGCGRRAKRVSSPWDKDRCNCWMQLFQQSPAALLPLQGPVLWLAHAINALGTHLGHSSHLLQHRAPGPCSNAGDMVSVGSDVKDSRVLHFQKESCWCCFCARRADLRMVFLWASCWEAGRYGESWLQAGDIAANGDASSQDCHWTCRIRKMWLLFFGWFRTFHLYRTFLCQGRLRWLWLNATAAWQFTVPQQNVSLTSS